MYIYMTEEQKKVIIETGNMMVIDFKRILNKIKLSFEELLETVRNCVGCLDKFWKNLWKLQAKEKYTIVRRLNRCGFNKWDIVLCTKFSIEQNMVIDESGIKVVPCVNDTWFNRKAYVSKVYKEYMEQTLGGTYEEKDEYEITFLDDGNTLAWVSGNDLTLMMRNDSAHKNRNYIF